jgi:hypothetical protein
MVQQNAEALHRAIVRADMRVVRLKVASRLRAAVNRSRDRVDDQLRHAELEAQRLHDTWTMLAVSGPRRRVTS